MQHCDKQRLPGLPSRILFDLQEGYCNLNCPKCIVHGSQLNVTRRLVTPSVLKTFLADLPKGSRAFQPTLWSEPLLSPHLHENLSILKDYGLKVSLNTNGILLNREISQFLVESKIDSVVVSIDAFSPETLRAVRGIDSLDSITANINGLLDCRGTADSPRIGVSFTREQTNAHEEAAFIDYWLQHVDVVRVCEVYEGGKRMNLPSLPERYPCPALYETMAVHADGHVSVCCLDAFRETNMGNVFSTGIHEIWNGSELQRYRRLHEAGRYRELPFCSDCNVWANFSFTEEYSSGMLVRRSPGMVYYNRTPMPGS